MMRVINIITKVFEEKNFVQSTYCDLQKAFDKMIHHIVLHKLKYYEIRGLSLKLFKSCLENRSQQVVINGYKSNGEKINKSIAQRSILGPTLFLLYINDLIYNVNSVRACLYADDSSFFNMVNSK